MPLLLSTSNPNVGSSLPTLAKLAESKGDGWFEVECVADKEGKLPPDIAGIGKGPTAPPRNTSATAPLTKRRISPS